MGESTRLNKILLEESHCLAAHTATFTAHFIFETCIEGIEASQVLLWMNDVETRMYENTALIAAGDDLDQYFGAVIGQVSDLAG